MTTYAEAASNRYHDNVKRIAGLLRNLADEFEREATAKEAGPKVSSVGRHVWAAHHGIHDLTWGVRQRQHGEPRDRGRRSRRGRAGGRRVRLLTASLLSLAAFLVTQGSSIVGGWS